MIRYLQSRAYLVCNPFATLQMGDCAIFKINYNSSSLLRMQNTSYIQLIYAPSNFAWIHRLFVTTGMCYNGGCCFCETSVASKCLREIYGIGPRARTMVTRITAGRHFACNFLTILIVSTSYISKFRKRTFSKRHLVRLASSNDIKKSLPDHSDNTKIVFHLYKQWTWLLSLTLNFKHGVALNCVQFCS